MRGRRNGCRGMAVAEERSGDKPEGRRRSTEGRFGGSAEEDAEEAENEVRVTAGASSDKASGKLADSGAKYFMDDRGESDGPPPSEFIDEAKENLGGGGGSVVSI